MSVVPAITWRKSSYSADEGQCVEVAALWRKSSRSADKGECVEVAALWRKSSRSADEGECVELAALSGSVIGIRDSKRPEAPFLAVSDTGFRGLLERIKSGQLT